MDNTNCIPNIFRGQFTNFLLPQINKFIDFSVKTSPFMFINMDSTTNSQKIKSSIKILNGIDSTF